MEIELKVEVADFEPIRERLRALGATWQGTVDEENLYLDRGDELERRSESLRLRRDDRVRLTWKGPTAVRNGVVERNELEVAVSDFATTLHLLERLGFRPVDRLAKRRETWHLAGNEVTLDALDFGTFVEIEGEAEAIRAVAGQLGLDLARAIPLSYRRLQRARSPVGRVALVSAPREKGSQA